jgi:predicted amidohydrolase
MSVKVAAAQNKGFQKGEWDNYAGEALRLIEEAGSQEARLVLLPQGFPGAFLSDSLAEETLGKARESAKKYGMTVVYGGMEPAGGGRYHLSAYIIDSGGDVIYRYSRSSPRGPFYYGTFYVDYIGADEPPRVVEVDGLRLGVVMCGEIFVPEISRLLGIDSVDIILNPACTAGPDRVSAWHSVVTTRAIENLCYVIACQQLRRSGDGIGAIAGPSGPISYSQGWGVTFAELDVDMVRQLHFNVDEEAARNRRDVFGGALHYRRPELFSELAAVPPEPR